MLSWVVGIILVLWLLAWMVNSTTKTRQKMQGRRNCRYCNARLKGYATTSGNTGYADHCRKCGRAQPWAAIP